MTSAGGGHTVAVLTTGAATSGESVPLAVNTAEPPAGRSTRASIVPAPCVDRQTAPGDATQVHETAVRSIGNVSCTGAPITGLGPAFATVIVYVIDLAGERRLEVVGLGDREVGDQAGVPGSGSGVVRRIGIGT